MALWSNHDSVTRLDHIGAKIPLQFCNLLWNCYGFWGISTKPKLRLAWFYSWISRHKRLTKRFILCSEFNPIIVFTPKGEWSAIITVSCSEITNKGHRDKCSVKLYLGLHDFLLDFYQHKSHLTVMTRQHDDRQFSILSLVFSLTWLERYEINSRVEQRGKTAHCQCVYDAQ